MKNNTIEAFKEWDKVFDYDSDETTVTIRGKRRKKIAEFNYPKFTREDFERFKPSLTTNP